MKPILCGGYGHPNFAAEQYEWTDCGPPQEVKIYGHDPRTGYATLFTEIVCPTCDARRKQTRRR